MIPPRRRSCRTGAAGAPFAYGYAARNAYLTSAAYALYRWKDGTVKDMKKTRNIVKRADKPIIVAGMGNVMLRDDGVGMHALCALRRGDSNGVQLADWGSSPRDQFSRLPRGARLLLLSAIRAGYPPGTVHQLREADLEKKDWSELLPLAALRETLSRWPHKHSDLALLGVEPADEDYGTTLSPEVRRALPSLLQAAENIIARWAKRQSGRAAGVKPPKAHTLPSPRLDLLHASA